MSRARQFGKFFTISIFVICGGLGSPNTAFAQDVSDTKTARFGFGVSDISSNNPPQVSLSWKASEASTLSAHTGLRNGSSSDFFEFGARFQRNLFVEENQDFFFFLGGGIATSSNESGYKLEAGAGSEIFLTGLPNFGLHFLAGFGLSTVSATSLQSIVSFGMHYYF